ncbi:MAG: preprotein translocase subunit YajC [Phycisphaerales bacterium]|nr:preprotein translocase subunit YajC [Phycisphaerales bacterium]
MQSTAWSQGGLGYSIASIGTLGQAEVPQLVGAPAGPVGSPATGQPASATGPAGGGGGGNPMSMGPLIWLLPALLVFMVLSTVMASRKEKRRRSELMSSIKKGERVLTSGGIIGTIVEMKDEDNEVVLRVDEVSNTRIRFAKSAIAQVLRGGAGGGGAETAKA